MHCSAYYQNNIGTVSSPVFELPTILLFAVVTLTATVIIIIVVTFLIISKRDNKKLKEDLRHTKANAVYDEVMDNIPPGSPSVETEKNVAYEQVLKVV